jgi:polyisoprenoid-binding protein YceI
MFRNACLTLLAVAPAFAQQYQIDSAHSSAQFAVKHMMVSNVRGEFQKVTGSVFFDPKNPAASKVEATIDATTVSTREEKRDGHLKSPDFLDVAKFPTITFKSTSVRQSGGKYNVAGALTIHGVTKPVTLVVDTPSPETKDSYGFIRSGASATTTISRKDFGLVWNQTLDNGGVVVGDQVTITLDVEMMRKPAEAATHEEHR